MTLCTDYNHKVSDTIRLSNTCVESGFRRTTEQAKASPGGARATQPPLHHVGMKEDDPHEIINKKISCLI